MAGRKRDNGEGLAERSLVLTLPKEPTDNDDSLLTASEVARDPRGGALSGLTHAFFAVASIGSS